MATATVLEVATLLRPSSIHGLGIFSDQPITKGTVVWSFRPGFDLLLDEPACLSLSPIAHRQILHYGAMQGGVTLLCGDDARFFNHSDTPNCDDTGPLRAVATRDIAEGEELTVNYNTMSIPSSSAKPAPPTVGGKYRKKPVVIDALQWTGRNPMELGMWRGQWPRTFPDFNIHPDTLEIDILELEDGHDRRVKHVASVGDYLIRGIQGEFYACKPDIFEASYESV